MAHSNEQQPPAAYPLPLPSGVCQPHNQQCYPLEKPVELHANAPCVVAPPPPPPLGYPTMDVIDQHAPPLHTQSKGDDFWKGCLAALCCCCVLDVCFC